jgi:hypothetical protein
VTAYRKNLKGVIIAPTLFMWNVGKTRGESRWPAYPAFATFSISQNTEIGDGSPADAS